MKKTVLCWDIDGTLLTTNKAGLYAWEYASQKTFGDKPDFSQIETAGRTDVEIAAAICYHYRSYADCLTVSSLLSLYESKLPESLFKKNGCVLPRVNEILSYFEDCSNVLSMLLTGNTKSGAVAKLRHYGLIRYFSHGAFADECKNRAEIAQKARMIINTLQRDTPLEQIYVIGDTPHDINCGKMIGVRTIAVATGNYSKKELLKYDPWISLDCMPTPEEFCTMIGLDAVIRCKERSYGERIY